MRMNEQQVKEEEEEEPWEEVKRKRWDSREMTLTRPSSSYNTNYSTRIKVNKEEKKWLFAPVIIYQSNTSCFESLFFNGSLFSSIEKHNKKLEKKRWGWDALPSAALLNIFCKSQLKDRLQSIPLVCKSWKYVTDDPRCWSSMIPDSVSPEDAFIKNTSSTSGYEFDSYECKSYYMKLSKEKNYDFLIGGISCLFKEEGGDQVAEEIEEEEEEEVHVGVLRLRTLIKKSGGGAAITTMYLSPFLQCVRDETFDEIFHLIAKCCPNLKHISVDISIGRPYMEAILQLFNKCKQLELIDLPNFQYNYDDDHDPLVIQDMGNYLPNLRGIRIKEYEPDYHCHILAPYLPQLKLLSLGSHYLDGEHLSVILFSCLELQYLYVKGHRWRLYYGQDNIVDQASSQIPEFYFEDYHHPSLDWSYGYSECLESMEDMLKCKETDIDDYRYIHKQRKEDQYVSILKKDQNVCIMKKKIKYYYILEKREIDQCNSRLKKKKKKKYQYDSTLKKKKKDQCDYADYVIH